jgi:hypothetical protein
MPVRPRRFQCGALCPFMGVIEGSRGNGAVRGLCGLVSRVGRLMPRNRQNRTRVNFWVEPCRKFWSGFESATGVESPERDVKMNKKTKLLGENKEANDNDDGPVESRSMPPYRIICNSEHFIVLNPVQRKTVKKDKGEVKDRLDIN